MTYKKRLFHSLHMELKDSIVITNVEKVDEFEVTFEYKNKVGRMYIFQHYVALDYSDNEKSALLDSYQDVINVLLNRDKFVK